METFPDLELVAGEGFRDLKDWCRRSPEHENGRPSFWKSPYNVPPSSRQASSVQLGDSDSSQEAAHVRAGSFSRGIAAPAPEVI